MSDNSKISWTDATWNMLVAETYDAQGQLKRGWHCEKVSPACANCYAEATNNRFGTGLKYSGGNRENVNLVLHEKTLLQPLKWKKPRKIFVCSMTDLFGEWVEDDWLDRIFAVIALCPQHTFQCLSKRPERMRKFMSNPRRPNKIARTVLDLLIELKLPKLTEDAFDKRWQVASIGDPEFPSDVSLKAWPLQNCWLGVTTEDQEQADKRIPILLETPAAVRWVSVEPMLGRIDLMAITNRSSTRPEVGEHCFSALPDPDDEFGGTYLDWIVCGSESGRNARLMHEDWANSLRCQCINANVPFFMKQMMIGGKLCKDIERFPADLQIRQFPQ